MDAPEPLSIGLGSDQPPSCASSTTTKGQRFRVYRLSWAWLTDCGWAVFQPISGFQISEFGINSILKQLHLNHQPCRRMKNERTALCACQPETNHKPHLAPAALHPDIWPLADRVGHYHVEQQQSQQKDR